MIEHVAIVRQLAAADGEAYKALRDEVLALHPSAFTSDAATESLRSAASYAKRLATEATCLTLGAWLDSTIVGALSCERESRIKVRHIGHLVGMMVRPGHESSGVGRLLLSACLDRLRANPEVELVTLSVTADNHRAVRLYEQAGFMSYGELPCAIRIDGRYFAKRLMRLQLRSQDATV